MNKQRPLPPKLDMWLLAHVADDTIRYSASGEFEEQFHYIADQTMKAAQANPVEALPYE